MSLSACSSRQRLSVGFAALRWGEVEHPFERPERADQDRNKLLDILENQGQQIASWIESSAALVHVHLFQDSGLGGVSGHHGSPASRHPRLGSQAMGDSRPVSAGRFSQQALRSQRGPMGIY